MDKQMKNINNIKNMITSASSYWLKEAPSPDGDFGKDLVNLFRFKEKAVIDEAFIWLKENYQYPTFPNLFNWNRALKEAKSKVDNSTPLIAYKAKQRTKELHELITNLENSSQWQHMKSQIKNAFYNEEFIRFLGNLKPLKIDGSILILLLPNKFESDWIQREFAQRIKTLFEINDLVLAIKVNSLSGACLFDYVETQEGRRGVCDLNRLVR